MKRERKSFFFFPTWILVVLSVVFMGATLFDIYLLFKLESFPTIRLDGIEYARGTPQYQEGIEAMRKSFIISAVVTFIVSITNGFYAYKRSRKYEQQGG